MAGTPGVALPSSRLAVVDATQVGEARRLAAAECRAAGLDETHAGRVALVVTEAATNIVRHGSGGEILLRVLHADGARGIEVLALDTGRGIEDVGRALRDGHSTAGTPGNGLGAIRRQSTVFDIYTSQGGTALLSQVWMGTPALPVHGAVCVAKPGETESGDVWALQVRPGGWRLIVADGLGHGLHAREAAVCVANAMLGVRDGLAETLNTAHLAARPTRGAAAAAVDVMPGSREVTYAGIGNISGLLLSPGGSRSMVSLNGTLGQGILRPREFSYPLQADSLVILFSDGLVSHWSLDVYPGLSGRHPALVTGVLYRDHSRRRDDVTVVAVRVPALQ